MREADLCASTCLRTHFYQAQLPEAKLIQADLTSALLIDSNLEGADLTGATI